VPRLRPSGNGRSFEAVHFEFNGWTGSESRTTGTLTSAPPTGLEYEKSREMLNDTLFAPLTSLRPFVFLTMLLSQLAKAQSGNCSPIFDQETVATQTNFRITEGAQDHRWIGQGSIS
jgi:hypothetical protein